jgi:hypothetical protein
VASVISHDSLPLTLSHIPLSADKKQGDPGASMW